MTGSVPDVGEHTPAYAKIHLRIDANFEFQSTQNWNLGSTGADIVDSILSGLPEDELIGYNYNLYSDTRELRFRFRPRRLGTKVEDQARNLENSRSVRISEGLSSWEEPGFVVEAHEDASEIARSFFLKDVSQAFLNKDREVVFHVLLSVVLDQLGYAAPLPWAYCRPYSKSRDLRSQVIGLGTELADQLPKNRNHRDEADYLERLIHCYHNCLAVDPQLEGKFVYFLNQAIAYTRMARGKDDLPD